MQEIRFAARLLWKSPLFTITAALSLAIGIGANTTIFSVANPLLMRPLPGVADFRSLVDLGRTTRARCSMRARITTIAPFASERPLCPTSSCIAYREPSAMSLAGRAQAERIYGTMVSGGYFPTLGTRAVVGRLLNDGDDQTLGAHPVAAISHALWERRFDANPGIAGQTIALNGHSFTVVGVTPRGSPLRDQPASVFGGNGALDGHALAAVSSMYIHGYIHANRQMGQQPGAQTSEVGCPRGKP